MLTTAEMAYLIGVDVKWIHNAGLRLRRPIRHSAKEAIRLSLAHRMHEFLAIPLGHAVEIANEALLGDLDAPFAVRGRGPDDGFELRIDLTRFLIAFNGRLAWMRTQAALPERGRPPKAPHGNALDIARKHGIDLSLVKANMRRTSQERMAALDENVAFLQQMQQRRA